MMKVFIADDSEHVRQSLKAMISKIEGVEIIGQAGEVGEAVRLVQELDPDVVLLDIRMPGGSGMDVLAKIKQNKPRRKVIMLTNYPYPQYQKKCMELGADFFFDKSQDFAEIPRVLKELINGGETK
ncbi:MAG TPA: response regulator transcription factor [archaeon]|nr:response regulator transcription factor [archaeon]